MKSNLPEGWSSMLLKEGIDNIPLTGYKLPQTNYQSEGTLPVIDQGQSFISGYSDELGLQVPCEEPVVVFGDHTRAIKFVDFKFVAGADGIKVLKPKSFYNPKLFFYIAQNIDLPSRGYGRHFKLLANTEIPLPPLAEQIRIVAKLDEAMQRVKASQARLEKLPKVLKQFRKSVLAAAVSGRLTEAWRAEHPQQETGADSLARIRAERRVRWEEKQLAKVKQLPFNDSWKQKYQKPAELDTSELPELPEGWVWTQVGEVFNKVSDGPFGSNLKGDDYTEEPGFQVIRLENIGWMEFFADKATFISEEKFLLLEKHEVFEGDIIFSSFISGNIRATLLEELSYRAINKADCFCLRDDYGLVCQDYLLMALSTERSFDELVSNVHGSTRPRINTTQLKALTIPFPSLTEQQEIVRQVNHYFTLADTLESRFEQASTIVEQLPQALLAKAFSGRLVPQDPNDEPASVLLERLRNAPAPAKTKAKRGRKPSTSTLQLALTVPQSLLEILTQHPNGISPEKLFSLAGFTDADVDSFYQELAKLQPQLEETKPIGEAAKTWPNTSSTLRLKTQVDAN